MPVGWFFLHNAGYKLGSKKIQIGIPMFFGIAYQMAASAITSLGRHIGFQDGHLGVVFKVAIRKSNMAAE